MATMTGAMKAIVHERYGSPDVLALGEVPVPVAEGDRVVVRVRATTVNPADHHIMRGLPLFMRASEGLRAPKRRVPGLDVAGVVEAVGPEVTGLRVGDHVVGGTGGAFAAFARVRERFAAHKPDAVSFEQAATLPTAGCTALQALRDHGRVQAGQRVLVNGAAGGVGTFAVQLAAVMGAEVTGVCGTANVEMVRSLGAREAVDYTRDDFARTGERYDVVVDAVGNRSLADLRRATTPKGTIVLVGGGGGPVLGPLGQLIRGVVLSRFVGQTFRPFLASVPSADLAYLAGLVADGRIAPVIGHTFPLEQAADAMRLLETRHARGKIVLTVG